jgi:hypothetical protein
MLACIHTHIHAYILTYIHTYTQNSASDFGANMLLSITAVFMSSMIYFKSQ